MIVYHDVSVLHLLLLWDTFKHPSQGSREAVQETNRSCNEILHQWDSMALSPERGDKAKDQHVSKRKLGEQWWTRWKSASRVLVDGIATPLKKYESVSWDDDIPNWKNKSHVQSPPTRYYIIPYTIYHYMLLSHMGIVTMVYAMHKKSLYILVCIYIYICIIHIWIHIWSIYDPYMIHIWSIYDPHIIHIWSTYYPHIIHILSIHYPYIIP